MLSYAKQAFRTKRLNFILYDLLVTISHQFNYHRETNIIILHILTPSTLLNRKHNQCTTRKNQYNVPDKPLKPLTAYTKRAAK